MLSTSLRAASLRGFAGLSLLALVFVGTLRAESRTFPYEATVRTAEVEVRSGPGQRYYVTGRVRLNDRVTVHRHDPGGWYMIAPPAGSFSYIDAAVVRRTGETSGIVEVPLSETGDAARAVVRIGSEFTDDYSYYGRELANGDTVQILSEKMLNTDRGAARMYRIAPPALEYRWVKGDFIVAEGESPRSSTIIDPAVTPAAATMPVESDPFARPFRPSTPSAPPAAPLPSMERASPATSAQKDALVELDLRYIELVQQSPENWDLDGLIRDYQAFSVKATAEQRSLIDERLAALESRRRIWTEYQDFVRLTSETSDRDAALVAMQTGQPAVAPPSQTDPAAPTNGIPAASGPVLGPTGMPQPAGAPTMTPPTATPETSPAAPKFDGAGVVQRMPTGRRGQFVHVLADPQGRVLAVLQAPPQFGLDRFVGQPLGIIGQRSFDPRMQSDVIQVRQVMPVQLSQ
jgi:hypothetical protein